MHHNQRGFLLKSKVLVHQVGCKDDDGDDDDGGRGGEAAFCIEEMLVVILVLCAHSACEKDDLEHPATPTKTM